MLATCLRTLATSLIYFFNIHIKQLQHTSQTSETLETYICNIGEGKPGAGRFRSSGWDPAASGGTRAPLAPGTLVGALGSAEEDLRRHGTCAPTAMAVSAARPTAMGDERTTSERGAQGTRTHMSGIGHGTIAR